MKRIISLVLVLLLALTLIAGCGDKDSDGQAANNSSAAGISSEDIVYIDGDTSVYRVVRPEDDKVAFEASNAVFKKMKDILGVNVRTVFDTEAGDGQYEVLVGNTNRPETEEAKNYLISKTGRRYNDFVVCSIGKKIVIYGQSDQALQDACNYFVTNFIIKEGVKGGIDYCKATEGNFETVALNGVDVGRYAFVRPHYNSSYLTEVEMKKIQDNILAKTGYFMEITHDTYTAEAPAEYEIIVGDTTREGVEKITDYDKFSIKVDGKKVYINGGSAHATAMGVSEFSKMLEKGAVTDTNGSYESALAGYDKSTTLYKTWGDDFDTEVVDTDKWRVLGKGGSDATGLNGKTSIRSNDPNDVYQADGKFYICAREDDSYYYGGMLRTNGGIMTYKYGYLEASMVIPHGDGFWIALWACSEDYNAILDPALPKLASPEIDIVECFGNSYYYEGTCHSWPQSTGSSDYGFKHLNPGEAYYCPDSSVKLGDGFHTYGFMWDDKALSFTCDGNLFYTLEYGDDPQMYETYNHSMYLILSMATGFENCPSGKITDDPVQWAESNKLIVDWVNIYQKDDGLCEMDARAN